MLFIGLQNQGKVCHASQKRAIGDVTLHRSAPFGVKILDALQKPQLIYVLGLFLV